MCADSQDVTAEGTGEGGRVNAGNEEAAGFPRALCPCAEAKLSRMLVPRARSLRAWHTY